MSFIKNYWAWLVLTVLLFAFLFVQWWHVPGKVAEIREKNRDPIQQLQNLDQLQSLLNQRVKVPSALPTRGDIDAIQRNSDVSIESLNNITRDWRLFTGGLNAFMSNRRNPNGEIFDPRTAAPPWDEKTGETGTPIAWNLFLFTLDGLYKDMFVEHDAKMVNRIQPRLERMLADQAYAADQGITMKMAEARARGEAATLARARARIVENIAALNRINVDERFNAENNLNDKEKGWAMWRRFLILRDLLVRVAPSVEAEIATTLYAHLPLGIPEREQYVRDRDNDELPPEQLNTPREPWPVTTWRHIERISLIDVSEPELGANTLASDQAGAEGKGGAETNPGAAQSFGRSFGAAIPPTSEGVGSYFDRYTIEIKLVAHPKVLEAFQAAMLAASQEAGMFYEPVSMAIKCYDEDSILPRSESTNVRSEGTRTTPLWEPEVTIRYDREPPVEAALIYHLIRFRYADTDNQTRPIEPEISAPQGRGGYFPPPEI